MSRLLPIDTLCLDCGFHHDAKVRIAALRRALPASVEELRALHPCWWGKDDNGPKERMLQRDLSAIGAVKEEGSLCSIYGVWRIP